MIGTNMGDFLQEPGFGPATFFAAFLRERPGASEGPLTLSPASGAAAPQLILYSLLQTKGQKAWYKFSNLTQAD